jgi:CubicO group peptidase (beta-lactamase class C family)
MIIIKSTLLNVFFFLLIQIPIFGQIKDIVKSEGIINPLHLSNIGKITFMGKYIPIENYQESDFLKSFEIVEPTDLNLRIYLANSLTNYLHILAPELTVEELTKKGNYQFSFFMDNKLVYSENLNVGAGSAEYKNTKTILRVPLINSANEDHWGRFMWNRFLNKGGQEALSEGTHTFKIEIKPYIQTSKLLVGDKIAEGEVQLIIPEKKVAENLIALQSIKPKSGWKISSEKIDEDKIRALNKKIVVGDFKNITSIVIIKEGKLLLEEYFNDANRKSLHDTRSVGKSFASALIGIAIKNGHITSENQLLKNFYSLKDFKNYSQKKDSITIKNLLTMSSAFEGSDMNQSSLGNEENMYPTDNWVNFTLNLPMDSSKTNGKQWDYFTAGTVLLGDIINKSVPNGLEIYAEKTLFKPLSIKNYQWQYTPQKVANTAGGLKMNSLDLAKFGQLYKNNGTWKSQQILPEEWVEKSLSHQINLPETDKEFYGYLFWNKTYSVNGKDHEVYYSSGNGGNKIFIFKDQPIVIIVTATAYNTPYAHSQVDKMVEKYLIPVLRIDDLK